MLRLLLDALSILYLLLAFVYAVTWLRHRSPRNYDYFGIGRGYRTLSLDTASASASITYTARSGC